jgi:hypothetical protein
MENFKNDQITKILSRRGKDKILHNGFAFNMHKEETERDIWRCRVPKCPSYLYTLKTLEIIRLIMHSHKPDFRKIL